MLILFNILFDTSPVCSPGYTPYLGSCLTVKTIYKTADDAERECAVEGGHLASIHDPAVSFNNIMELKIF